MIVINNIVNFSSNIIRYSVVTTVAPASIIFYLYVEMDQDQGQT